MPSAFTLEPVILPGDLGDTKALFLEYARSLGFSLCFQGFDRELAELPGKYAPPAGRLIIARANGVAAGCIALRQLGPETCEMKRLYVRPMYQGRGLGRALASHLIDEARRIGYRWMRLDTLPQMTAAIPLYRSLGFSEIVPYYPNPVAGALFMELDLGRSEIRR